MNELKILWYQPQEVLFLKEYPPNALIIRVLLESVEPLRDTKGYWRVSAY